MPPWRFWAAVFSFLLDVSHWGQQAREDAWTDYVASSRARDLYEHHERRLKQAGITLPSTERGRGIQYLDIFHETVEHVCDWTRESL